ncbi:hypothetical protein PR048_032222 [Dryococelus australis]|uniref:Reverse transcriptase n=1 Tax=Dryococelus australis TaxID=614101 RepID=A0ABQ9G1K9_9NEOP|nr:hypothetical protein PR048_032222 [Dryococelus australis]
MVLFNLALVAEVFPLWMLKSRTVLIPKVQVPSVLVEFRPISITRIILRHFHKLLSACLVDRLPIAGWQHAFIKADGMAENLSLLTEVLHRVTSRRTPLYMAIIDVKKAFDAMAHVPRARSMFFKHVVCLTTS